mgnify:CR=1 FL=1
MTHEIDYTIDIEAYAKEMAKGMSLEQLREKQGYTPLSKGSIPPLAETKPVTDEGRAHMARLKSTITAKIITEPRRIKQEMPYDDADFEKWVKQGWISTLDNGGVISTAKRKVWALLEMRAAHISVIENRDFSWIFDENLPWIIRNMTKYFINDPSCEFTGGLAKGLFLYGLPGTMKTEIMQIFERFCRENDLQKQFQITSMSEVYAKAKVDSKFDPITPNVQLNRCFDEFGRYTGAVMNFGESIDINEVVIEQRYPRFRNGGQLTHIIANIEPNQTEPMFTPMIFDRIKQMCTSVHFQGQSKRK